MKNWATRIGLVGAILAPCFAYGQDIDDLLDPNHSLPDYVADTTRGVVVDRKTLEEQRRVLLEQFTKGQCSPAIAQVGGNVTVNCYLLSEAEKEGVFVVDRVTKLVPSDDKEKSASLDVVMSNMRAADVWIKRVTVVGLGSSNARCNPNPIATFRYKVSITAGQEVTAKVSSPEEKLALPVTVKIGEFEHSYCDGYLFLSYDQSIKVPKREKLSYVLTVDSIQLELVDSAVTVGFNENMTSRRDMDDKPIPRLGLSLSQVRDMGGVARSLTPRRLFEQGGPSYRAPLWGAWFVFLQLDDGTIVGGKTGFGASQSDKTKVWDGEAGGGPLYGELEKVGIPAPVAAKLFASHWIQR